MRRALLIAATAVLATATATATAVGTAQATVAAPAVAAKPPAHIVVVMEENHSYGDIIGNPDAPYMNRLATTGRLLNRMYAITHPSEPNYVALFSGSQQGLTDDSCPHTWAANNLGAQLRAHHKTFAGYAEGLPKAGSKVCYAGAYARRHVPWSDFSNLPQKKVNLPFTAFPTDYAKLPTVSFVIPNLNHDMHDGTIAQADTWLRKHLRAYARWAPKHNSQLVVIWDEDDHSANNHIATIITGAGVTTGAVTRRTTTYSLLRLIETDYKLHLLGGAASAPTIRLK